MCAANEKLGLTKLVDQARHYLLAFYLLGQNSFNPRINRDKYYNKLINVAPSIISILSSFSASIMGIIYRYNYEGFYEQTDSVVTYVLLLLHFATNCVTMLQALFHASDMQLLFEKFENVQQQSRHHLHYEISFDNFDKGYRRKAGIVVTVFCASVLIRFYFQSAKTHIVVQTAQMLLLGFTLTDNLHSLFYIHLLMFFKSSLTGCVRNFANQSMLTHNVAPSNGQSIITSNLRYVKRIHYLLFNISLTVNKCFGWGLVALMILNFVEVAYTLYWVFLYLSAYHSHLFIRKYN